MRILNFLDTLVHSSKCICLFSREEFLKEASILKDLHHPNLVQVYAICVEKSPYLMVMELMENGDLRNYMRHRARNEGVSFEKLIEISEDVNLFRRKLCPF